MYQTDVVDSITKEYVNELEPSFELDFLVGKSIGLFTHFVSLDADDVHELDERVISTLISNKINRMGEYFINIETNFTMVASSWSPSTDATQLAYLIDEYRPAINFINIGEGQHLCVVIVYPHLVMPHILTPLQQQQVYTATDTNFIKAFCKAIILFHNDLGETYT